MTTNAVLPTRAVVTIVSANYLARARALCRSLMEHVPGVRRFVLLVDRRIPGLLERDEPFEALWVDDLGIPEFEDFMAQYTVMEANTAVKPYVLAHLFETHSIDRLVYLDPDILLLAPLDEVWSALERGNVVLTPHLRDSFRDAEFPTERQILASGTYNLGFIGLRRGETATRLLEWWGEKTKSDCVVDLANDIFVDQRWMDLVPGYFEGVVVLRDPGYNVAYWNLHERPVTRVEGRYFADGRPLSFFHFSGFEIDRPWILSTHQSRHDLNSLPEVKRLFETYAALLRVEGHDETRQLTYGFSALRNGIPLSAVLRKAVRHLRKSGLGCPPVRDADAFCEFVMTPNAAACGTEISPFVHALLAQRPDLEPAYPMARYDARNSKFVDWLDRFLHEVDCAELYARFKERVTRPNAFDRVLVFFERREDLRAAHPDAFSTGPGFEAFAEWVERQGAEEMGLEEGEIREFVEAGRSGFERVVEYYLASPDLHRHFPLALLPGDAGFVEWLIREGTRSAGFTVAQIRFFDRRIRDVDVNRLVLLTALRNEWVRLRFPLGATTFGWTELVDWIRVQAAQRGHVLPQLMSEPPSSIPPLFQLETLHGAGEWAARFPDALRSREGLRLFADAAITATDRPPYAQRAAFDRAIASFSMKRGVNLAGYFQYAAGVGSSVRSLSRTLTAAQVPYSPITVPVCPSGMTGREADPAQLADRFFDRHRLDYEVDVTVANADGMRAARSFLGPAYGRERRHIGYWVWETDTLPGRFADAAEGLECVFTPSEFSARGIRKTLGESVRVEVVPHAVAPPMPGAHCPIALPDAKVLVGSFFDARSVLERKNPEGLLRAFRLAFKSDDPVALVLKVNHSRSAPEAMRRLEALAEDLPVIWIRDVLLDEVETISLVNRLDVYASLHRSEGFGLVLAEAMALGKPVVATGFSANTEFMDDTCARLVQHTEVVTDRAYGAYPRGTRWAEPDVEHAAQSLRALALDKALRHDLGRRAQRRIEETLSPSVVARTLLARLGWEGNEPPASTVSDDFTIEDQDEPSRSREAETSLPHAESLPARLALRGH